MYLKLLTPPAELPVTLETVKQHLRVDGTEEDAYITLLVKSAVNQVQNFTNMQLMRATYRLTLDRLPSSVPLPRPPFATISNFTAIDADGLEVAFDDTFYTLTATDYTTVRSVPDSGWYASTYKDIVIEYEAGYETAEEIPEDIINALLLIIHDRYENRGDSTERFPKASQALLSPYRIFNI